MTFVWCSGLIAEEGEDGDGWCKTVCSAQKRLSGRKAVQEALNAVMADYR